MIRKLTENDFAFTAFATDENRLRTWMFEQGFVHTGTVKYDFFPFTCGYLEREL